MDPSVRFRDQDYLIVPDFLEDPLLVTSYRYAMRLAVTGQLLEDAQSPGSLSRYGDVLMDTLLELATPTVSSVTGLDLAPTYSFLRIYTAGNALSSHTDRDACEVTVSLCLGSEPESDDGTHVWPIYMRPEGCEQSVALACRSGDALVFRGRKLEHWREPFDGEHQAYVFLHYVDKNGPFAGLEYDGRTMLGTPAARPD